MVDLDTVPDVLGLTGRRTEAAVVRVLYGREARRVRTLIPDPRVLERGFHDIAIVDMEDLPGQTFPVSAPVASDRATEYGMAPKRVGCYAHGGQEANLNSRPGDCSYCGKWIKCDMYRHVSTYHLDLGQLWWCPVSWCTVWKGTPQDCVDHVRGGARCAVRYQVG